MSHSIGFARALAKPEVVVFYKTDTLTVEFYYYPQDYDMQWFYRCIEQKNSIHSHSTSVDIDCIDIFEKHNIMLKMLWMKYITLYGKKVNERSLL